MAVGTAAICVALSLSSHPADIQVAHARAGDLVLHEQDSVGLCPWRNPERDRQEFFPTSTEVREETLILSRKRTEVARQLGRVSTGEENALKVYRILRHGEVIGSVVARRVRGESGVIELLLAVGTDGNILGARLQRMREPDDVAHSLQSGAWLGAFVGKNRASDWRLGADIPDVPPAARVSGAAILDAAHALLVLLTLGDSPAPSGATH
ncbi:MAG: Electron transport complex subunit RsxG [Chthonomonadaceae bacterium]|nr:Electron transport complex subunit RsxG [Chthonomonadaceae bacterium]